jgi:hypothetical protein
VTVHEQNSIGIISDDKSGGVAAVILYGMDIRWYTQSLEMALDIFSNLSFALAILGQIGIYRVDPYQICECLNQLILQFSCLMLGGR